MHLCKPKASKMSKEGGKKEEDFCVSFLISQVSAFYRGRLSKKRKRQRTLIVRRQLLPFQTPVSGLQSVPKRSKIFDEAAKGLLQSAQR
jgi:hypothetical protein